MLSRTVACTPLLRERAVWTKGVQASMKGSVNK